jgi:hypothetical protein
MVFPLGQLGPDAAPWHTAWCQCSGPIGTDKAFILVFTVPAAETICGAKQACDSYASRKLLSRTTQVQKNLQSAAAQHCVITLRETPWHCSTLPQKAATIRKNSRNPQEGNRRCPPTS